MKSLIILSSIALLLSPSLGKAGPYEDIGVNLGISIGNPETPTQVQEEPQLKNGEVNYDAFLGTSNSTYSITSSPADESDEFREMMRNPYGAGVSSEQLLTPNKVPLPGDGYDLPTY